MTTVPQSLSFYKGQVGYLKAYGFDITVISSPGQFLAQFATCEHIDAQAVEMPRRITPLGDLAAIFGIWKALRRIRPHIVHASTPKAGLLGMVSAWLAGVPVRIYHVLGLPFLTATGCKRKVLTWTERVSCALAHRVLCVSASARQVAVDSGLCTPGKITVLAKGSVNGVDAVQQFNEAYVSEDKKEYTRRRCNIPVNAPVLGFVGRIVRDKGIVELAAAWSTLRERFPSLHLLLVGPRESQDPIPPEVDRVLQSDPRVHFVGAQWDPPPFYALMDVLVLPTYREGFGNVVLEAAGMRVPAVATRIPGCVDAVQDGVTGMLVPPRDAAGLTRAISSYLQDPGLRIRHGAAARRRVLLDFRPEGIWQATYQEYVQCLQNSGVMGLRQDVRVPVGRGLAD